MRLLLHICCGPCLVFPLSVLHEEGIETRGYFFNPNIHPYSEFKKRLDSLAGYAQKMDLPLIIRDDYPLEDWLRAVAYRESERCFHCYHLRLSAVARAAKKSGYDAFSTTLLYSKLQKHERIRAIAFAAAKEAGVEFFYRDFRQGWQEGIEASKEAGLYRQNYCGCIYSERDRFAPRERRALAGRGAG